MAKEPRRRSKCPIAFALDLFGDRWTLLVVRDLAFKGKRRFSELSSSDEGIATNILTERLARLERLGLVEKTRDPRDGRRFLYRLSNRGKSLVPVLVEIIVWSAEHDPDTSAPPEFIHEAKHHRERLVARLLAKLEEDE